MKYKHTLIGSFAALFLISCGNSSNNETTEVKAPSSTSAYLSDTVVHPVAPVTPVTVSPTTEIHPALNPAAPAVAPGTKLNPAHGQPGHRCEIAVGAPLDSKAAPATTPAVVVDPFANTQPKNAPGVTVTSTPPASAKTSSAGLNPAHGQPGHRCEIAVGAPLDSKPTTTPGVTTQSLPLTASEEIKPTPIVTPAAPAPTPVNKTVTAPGMNPPHGEPGHRCDISVGAPLNSAPKKN